MKSNEIKIQDLKSNEIKIQEMLVHAFCTPCHVIISGLASQPMLCCARVESIKKMKELACCLETLFT